MQNSNDKTAAVRPDAAETGLSRRLLIGAGAAATVGLAATAAHAQSLQTTTLGKSNASAADLGPRNKDLEALNPDAYLAPSTDHGSVQQFWQSFSQAHRRIQDGGWARQVNVKDFPISTEIASVNMKLNAGGVRELHWHEADEWSLMLAGSARLTAIDYDGHPYVKDVKAGDLWYFPQGIPHSIQGLGPDGCEFLLVFDQGKFSEDDTTLLTDWLIHTPPDVVGKNFGVGQNALDPLKAIPPEGRYIFQAPVPPAIGDDVAAVTQASPATKTAFDFGLLDMTPTKEDASGSIRIVDSRTFKISKNIAAAYVVVKPGALRELHWHTNVAEWQYYISGKGRMTLFANKSDSRTIDFRASDVGYVPVTLPHYIENTGDEDLIYLEMFKSATYDDISLNNWLAGIPPELVQQHLGLSKETMAAIPKTNLGVVGGKKA
jgi:oxalate decarboxylase